MTALAAAFLVLVAAFVWWRFRYFHRTSERAIPPGSLPLCPADGRIIYVEDVSLVAAPHNPYHERVRSAFSATGEWKVVATYLSIFDEHFVRAPVSGKVTLHHVEPVDGNASMGGSFIFAALRRPLPIGKRAYTEKNEFLGVSIEGEFRVMLVLMADWWIDQIVTLVTNGDQIIRGAVIGKIQMGSQVDVWLPVGVFGSVAVSVGEAVRASETVLGRRSLLDSTAPVR